jgi:hypothetical protein
VLTPEIEFYFLYSYDYHIGGTRILQWLRSNFIALSNFRGDGKLCPAALFTANVEDCGYRLTGRGFLDNKLIVTIIIVNSE